MTDSDNGLTPEPQNTAADREAAQKRLQELIERNEKGGDGTSRRTRVILVVVLIVLLLLLCGVGAFLARLLIPNNDTKGSGLQGSEDTGGIIWIRSIYGFGPDIRQMFVNPNGVATGPDGIVWVTDPGGDSRIVGFRGDGTFVKLIQGSRQTGQPFRVPSQIAVDPSNIMYIADRTSERLTVMDGQKKLADSKIPGLMSVAADDQIIVVGSKAGFAVLDKDGNVKTIVGTKGSGPDQFDTVSGVALDSASKTIYVVDTYNNRLSAWDYNGKRKWIVTTGNPPNDVKLAGGTSIVTSTTAPAKLQLPVSVTVDGKGRPMVLDGFGFTISAFEPTDGKYVGSWGAWGEADGQFLYPTAVSYDKTKDWFLVADTSNLRAQIVRIPGTSAGGASGALSGLQRLLAGPLRALWPCCILLPLLLLLLLLGRWRKRRRELQGGEVKPAAEGADEELSQV